MSIVGSPMTFALQPMRGNSRIHVVEPDKDDVRTPRKHIVRKLQDWPPEEGTLTTTTLGHSKSYLGVSEWDFYTALMKTELAYSLPGDELEARSYGAHLQHRALLKWNVDGLRIAPSGVFSRKDSARTGLSGRFGEALAYLYMISLGNRFWDHLPSLVERAMESPGYTRDDKLKIAKALSRPKRPDGKRVREPDFAFENEAEKVSLAEAKGAFVNPEEAPSMAKSDLSEGLEQTRLWKDHVVPTPERSFAIGAYLREENDPHSDPSILAVVDPVGQDEKNPVVRFPEDWIRRGNYAAWMRGMGLFQSAEYLAYGRSVELSRRTFTTVNIGGQTFAVVPISWMPSRRGGRQLLDPDFAFFPPFFRRFDVHVLGIETRNFGFIEKAVNVSGFTLPVAMTVETASNFQRPDWFSGSIFPDGTLNGVLHFDNGGVSLDTQEVRL